MIHPTTEERHVGQFQNLLVDFVLAPLSSIGGNIFVKITLEIVDVRTHTTVMRMQQEADSIQGVVHLINADLDRLDAATFADEWGIKPRQ
jgi:hypothetical protein